MNQEIMEYEKYLLSFGLVEKPPMPNFDLLAYTDNEYQQAIFNIMHDFDVFDDESLFVQRFLKGD